MTVEVASVVISLDDSEVVTVEVELLSCLFIIAIASSRGSAATNAAKANTRKATD